MTIETVLTKRRALYKGEIGLFATSEMAYEDLAPISMNDEVTAELRSERKIQALRFLWGLVYKAYQNTNYWIDKETAMDWFKTRARYTKMVVDPATKELMPRPKSLKRINDTQLRLLTDRTADIMCTEIMPGMAKNDLYREIEEMMKPR